MTFGPDEIREARTLTSTGPEMLAKNYVTKLRTTLIAALDALEEAQKDNKKMSAMLDRIANHPTVADYFHAPSEECVADGVEGAIEDLEARAEKAERELGEAQKELETVRMDAAKEAARAARTILGNERTRAEKAERERDEARESLQRLSQVKFHTEHEYAKVFSRAEAAEAKVRELEGSLSAQSWEKMEKDLEVVDHLSADLLRERERVQELEEALEEIIRPPAILSPMPLKTPLETERIRVIGIARSALSHTKEVKPLPRPEDESPCYRKFDVTRADGSSEPGKKHERCDYFVLDWTHDKYAKPAALAYADACESEFPELAGYLRKRAAEPHPAKEGT